jgi:hypothetical protein
MKFITVGRFVINANLIMSIEVFRAGNGSDVKITGLEHAIRLSDQETEALIGLIPDPEKGPPGVSPIPTREPDEPGPDVVDPGMEPLLA